MRYLYSILKADYQQRTRSYAFLITLAVTIYVAYSFVPEPTASYTTLNMVGYKPIYNAAWVGYVSAIMTSVMLSLYGYFLINSGIKKDIETEVGLIIATTPITNFAYLLSKMLSNFIVLLTIAGCTFIVSIGMFFLRTTDQPFIFSNFILPYLFFPIPALFVISGLAVVGEVFFRKHLWIQYLVFFFLFSMIMTSTQNQSNDSLTYVIDPFGLKCVLASIRETVDTQFHTRVDDISFGFIFSKHKKPFQTFTWDGVHWTSIFLLSRLVWMGLSLGLVYVSSFFFHRFDFRQVAAKKKMFGHLPSIESTDIVPVTINRASLPALVTNYSIIPFIKTELLLLLRKGNRWLWLLIGGLWISMLFVPLEISHSILLPIIWFLQVNRWSDLATKEKTNRLHYFTYSSYKPLQRMLPAQMLAGIILAISLALPVIGRYLITKDMYAVSTILSGAVLIVLLSVCLGIVSGGKKLFEILFFILTYAIINKVPMLDYLGAVAHDNLPLYTGQLLVISFVLGLTSFLVRSYQTRHL
ncbi:hypothetical protein [Xanthocytophaga agilis]|uniref:Uncharacterized protein n=1 Tax=Xanthocytophaga agilis TaxID=3048010 RepID=A0AAE3RCF3_9BACT|nr:hypothetical protein [Xanthocytophaga agilis]MDJ1505028.1 hypothetical protein [Xanthocytophaga agilis]